ncbi:MAG: hypothetical protein ABEN55_23095, partial [Bradymonadaceae bacterium]
WGCGKKETSQQDTGMSCSKERSDECCPEEQPEEGTSCCRGCGPCEYDTPACPEALPIFYCRDGKWKQTGHADQTQCGDASDVGDDASDTNSSADTSGGG